MTNVVKTLKNGVVKYSLDVQENFYEAQRMFDVSDVLENVDVEFAWNERENREMFNATYGIFVERKDDYNRFIRMYNNDRYVRRSKELDEFRYKFRIFKNKGFYPCMETLGEFAFSMEWHYEYKLNQIKEKQSNDVSLIDITFENWKTNKIEINGRIVKLGKHLKKYGYDKELIDFYATQVKTEKQVFLTISDLPQHIAGMSHYVDLNGENGNRWDGMRGSSCQDPRHDSEEYISCLAGSMHDNKLYVALLHDSLDDLENMQDKLKARVVLRMVHVYNEPVLIATQYYGNNETKAALENAINKLEEEKVFGNHVCDRYDSETVRESANGSFEMQVHQTVFVNELIDEYVECECPMCQGSGEYEVYASDLEEDVNIDCPMCQGSGNYETHVYESIEHEETVSAEREVRPYCEGYDHNFDHIDIEVDKDYVFNSINSFYENDLKEESDAC